MCSIDIDIMSRAVHVLLDREAAGSHRIPGVEGNFPTDVAILEGVRVVFHFPYCNTKFSFR
jgi:hypothetical protein